MVLNRIVVGAVENIPVDQIAATSYYVVQSQSVYKNQQVNKKKRENENMCFFLNNVNALWIPTDGTL